LGRAENVWQNGNPLLDILPANQQDELVGVYANLCRARGAW